MDEQRPGRSPIVLYDDQCGLCSRWVQFILDHDVEGLFRFAGLGSDAATRAMGDCLAIKGDTVAVLTPEGILTRSDAVLYVLERLSGFACAARVLRWLPRPIRNRAYNLVARYRKVVLRARPGVCRIEAGPRDRFL
jgi:predicted DCC family thiol-disulfide oxidoreductase YuxK